MRWSYRNTFQMESMQQKEKKYSEWDILVKRNKSLSGDKNHTYYNIQNILPGLIDILSTFGGLYSNGLYSKGLIFEGHFVLVST